MTESDVKKRLETQGYSQVSLKADPALARIPVVMLSVLDESEMARSLGAAGCLTRPVQREALLAIVQEHCSADEGR